MDEVKSDLSTLQSEIAQTEKLIQELDNAEESILQKRRIVQIARNKIDSEIEDNEDEIIRWGIDRVRVHIVALEQFPNKPPIYDTRVYTKSSLSVKTEVEQTEESIRNLSFHEQTEVEQAVRKLNIQFHHNNKNLATERKIGRELQYCQSKLHEQRVDHHAEDQMQEPLTDCHYTKYRCVKYDHVEGHYYRVKPLNIPTEDTKGLIKMWAEKIRDVTNGILEDSKISTPTSETGEELRKLEKFGMQFYWHVGVGREEFKSLWDSMKDTKKTIAEIKSSLIKVRNRHQKACLKLDPLKKKRTELEKSISELRKEDMTIYKEKNNLKWNLKELCESLEFDYIT